MKIEKETTDNLWTIPFCEKKLTKEELFHEIEKKISDSQFEWTIGIGTDSQTIGKFFNFTSVVCIYKKGKGGNYYYQSNIVSRKKFPSTNQIHRMFEEVTRSINLAVELENTLVNKQKPIIHIDASTAEKNNLTSSFSEQLEGYVIGSGFNCVLKPDSYVASCIADRHSKKTSNSNKSSIKRINNKR